MTKIAVVDCETTGLDPQLHFMWELAIIVRGASNPEEDGEWLWQRWPDNMAHAEAQALNVSGFYERKAVSPRLRGWMYYAAGGDVGAEADDKEIADDVARLLSGAYLVASNPAFDAAFIDEFLRVNGHGPAWKYHLLDVRALAIGRLAARGVGVEGFVAARSHELFRELGVHPEQYDTHTAIGDARLARDVYDAVLGGGQ